MFDGIIKEKKFCGLDIGPRSVKASLLKAQGMDALQVLGVHESKTKGFKDASVTDLGEFSECIHHTMSGLTKKTGVKVKDVQLGVGGDLVEPRGSSALIPLVDRGSKVITFTDINKVRKQAQLLGLNADEEVLHDFPRYYRVDDVNIALHPLGLYGRKLEVDLLLILAHTTRIRNIVKAVNQAGYEVANLFFSSYAAAQVSLDDKMQREGCVLVDIGSCMTNLLMFKGGILKHLTQIPLGGWHVTKSIAQTFHLSFDLAEEIKESYAMAASPTEKSDEEILVKNETAYVPIKREAICQSIEPEIEKIVAAIAASLKKAPIADQINSGVVMVGGCTILPGLMERIEKAIHWPVRMGKVCLTHSTAPSSLRGEPSLKRFAAQSDAVERKVGEEVTNFNMINAPVFMSAIGLAQCGFVKSMRFALYADKPERWTVGLSQRVRELYQEYF